MPRRGEQPLGHLGGGGLVAEVRERARHGKLGVQPEFHQSLGRRGFRHRREALDRRREVPGLEREDGFDVPQQAFGARFGMRAADGADLGAHALGVLQALGHQRAHAREGPARGIGSATERLDGPRALPLVGRGIAYRLPEPRERERGIAFADRVAERGERIGGARTERARVVEAKLEQRALGAHEVDAGAQRP